ALLKNKLMLIQNCAVDSLAPYTPQPDKPWNARRVAHLYRRLGAGATYEEIQTGLSLAPDQLVDQLIDAALVQALPEPPIWANYTVFDYLNDPDQVFVDREELLVRWLRELAAGDLRSHLVLFWHNHFVTELDVYGCNSYLWSYYELLHQYALGNFRTFVEEIGKNPAMLVYLNGNENIAEEPNENYARELLELFTMGESNGYTQDDIVEVARALTGWRVDMYECTPPYFENFFFDSSNKTIFGQTSNWNYDTVHELIFTARRDQIATYICEEIYKHFVYPEVNPGVIANLATTFKNNNFELAPVFKQLFKSEHFFDETLIATRIKSPVQCLLNLLKESGLSYGNHYDDETLSTLGFITYQMGQELFNPIDVAGWPGHRDWINENTLTFRWSFASQLLSGYGESAKGQLLNLALNLTDASNDPALITQAIAEHFLGRSLEAEHLEVAILYLKGDIPENYYLDGSWTLYWAEAPDQLINLLGYLTRLPEFQLV
ncbi:MAG: DUF1800 domain-containing protein, partial [Bacteroidota bacterium]